MVDATVCFGDDTVDAGVGASVGVAGGATVETGSPTEIYCQLQ